MFGRNKQQGEDSRDAFGLDTLWPPANESDRDAIVDIVFVHGLNGKRCHTWTKDGVLWPRDLLANDFKRARIMTWGYDANSMKFFGPTGQGNIQDHAKALNRDLCQERFESHQVSRPIIFVAHSLGGLVVKKALFLSYLDGRKETPKTMDPRLVALKKHTKGILFAGTPHRGSDKAKWIFTATRLAQFAQKDGHGEVVNALRRGSHPLEELQDCFKEILECFAVYTLLEELPFPKIGKIVEKDSALIGWHEKEVLIHANHMDMVKFASETDNNYKKVRNTIREIISDRIAGMATEEYGSPQITRTRTSYPPGIRRASETSRLNSDGQLRGLSVKDNNQGQPFFDQLMERSSSLSPSSPSVKTTTTPFSATDEIMSAMKQGNRYLRQKNRKDLDNLKAADQNFMRVYETMRRLKDPNPALLVEILLEIVHVRTEMSYNRRLSAQDKLAYISEAEFFSRRACKHALHSPVVGHLALVRLHQSILSGRNVEINAKMGTTAQGVCKQKEKAMQEISISLGALLDSGDPCTKKYRKWADERRERLMRI